MFSVKNADSGYDAARDCLVILVSPAYTAEFESDAIWNQELAYWAEVVELLKHRENVQIAFREQFLRGDNGKPRIREMADVSGATAAARACFSSSFRPLRSMRAVRCSCPCRRP